MHSMEEFMKSRISALVICIVIVFTCGCVDYQQVVESMQEGSTAKNTNKTKVSLNDINCDGKIEEIAIENNSILLLSETKVLGRFEPHKDLEYENVSAAVIDIDNDNVMEIVVYAHVDTEHNNNKIMCVYVIDSKNTGEYYLRDMPEEITGIYSYSGVDAKVEPLDEYKYVINCVNNEFKIDASRVYGLSTLDVENREKLEDRWTDMLEKKLTGEVLGVVSAQIIYQDENQKCIRYYELVKGIDRKDIGRLVVDVFLDKDGTYKIVGVDYIENVDYQP